MIETTIRLRVHLSFFTIRSITTMTRLVPSFRNLQTKVEFYDDQLELHNLHRDISESRDLSRIRLHKRDHLLQQLCHWRTPVGAVLPTDNPDFDRSRRNEFQKRKR